MKVMKRILFWSAVTMIAAVSCNKFENDAPVQDAQSSFIASVEGADTKTVLDGMKSYWNGTEGIRVFDGVLTNGKVYEATVEKAQTAKFVEKDAKVKISGDDYFAAYPEGPSGSVTWDGNVASPAKKFWLPGDQAAVAGSYDPSTHIAVAYAEAGNVNLEYKNVCALVKVTVANDNVSEICFYGNSGEAITGNFDVLYNGGEPVASFATGYTKNTYAKISGNIEKGNTYYISILPTTFKAGFSIEFVVDGVKYTKKLSKEYTVERNEIITLPVAEFEIETVETTKVYLLPSSSWETEKGRYAAWCWGTNAAGTWYDLTDTDGDGIYELELPATFESIVFCCMKAGSTNDWKNKIYQTGDLVVPADDKNCYIQNENKWATLDEAKAYEPDVILAQEGWIYLKPNSNWLIDGARFAIYLCNGSKTAVWYSLTAITGTPYYGVKLPDGFNATDYKNIIFCRMNPSNATNDWEYRWNQSGNLDSTNITTGGKNCCAINAGQWDCGTNVTWSTLTRLN